MQPAKLADRLKWQGFEASTCVALVLAFTHALVLLNARKLARRNAAEALHVTKVEFIRVLWEFVKGNLPKASS
jgi:hypothetical protein